MAVHFADDGIGVAAQFDAGHIRQMHHRAIRRGLEDDVAELIRGLKLGLGGDGGVQRLAGNGGLAADRTGGDLNILGLDGGADIGRLQGEVVELIGVQPDAHRVLGAEILNAAHARDAAQRVLHLGRHEVGDVQGGVTVGGVIHGDDQQEVGLRLGDRHAQLLHLAGQLRYRLLHLVLDLHLGDVRIGARRESGDDRNRAVGIGLGREIQKIIQAGELLLDHLGHGILHGRGIGAGIEGIHRHRRWRDGGILLHRQGEGRNGACQHDDDGDDPGEDRPVDEEAR